MNWNQLTQMDQITQINELSNTKPVVILKHSTRCIISSTALARIEREWKVQNDQNPEPFYLDLLQHRDISNALANEYNVEHQSPQILLIKAGKCVYSETHSMINYLDLIDETIKN